MFAYAENTFLKSDVGGDSSLSNWQHNSSSLPEAAAVSRQDLSARRNEEEAAERNEQKIGLHDF
jgi:hypothetical protein